MEGAESTGEVGTDGVEGGLRGRHGWQWQWCEMRRVIVAVGSF